MWKKYPVSQAVGQSLLWGLEGKLTVTGKEPGVTEEKLKKKKKIGR